MYNLYILYRMSYSHTEDSERMSQTFDLPAATLHRGTEPPQYHEAINIETVQLPESKPPPYTSTATTDLDASVTN